MYDRNGYRLWVPPFSRSLPFWEGVVYLLKNSPPRRKPFLLPAIDIGNASVRDSSNRPPAGGGRSPLWDSSKAWARLPDHCQGENR